MASKNITSGPSRPAGAVLSRRILLSAGGQRLIEVSASGDAAFFEVSPGDLVQLQVEFS